MSTVVSPSIIAIDLVGELDDAMSASLEHWFNEADTHHASVIVVSFERTNSIHWGGLCDLAAVLAAARDRGFNVHAYARLRRVRALLDEFAVPTQAINVGGTHRRVIIARTPRPQVA